MLDWEGWGKARAGYDAATRYCYSLLVPSVAEQLDKMFSDILNTRDGVITQRYVITRLLRRIVMVTHWIWRVLCIDMVAGWCV